MRRVPSWLQRVFIGRNPKRTFFRVVAESVIGLTAFLFFTYVFLPVRIKGPSMYPTIEEGQIKFINRFAYCQHEPQRGDIVAIRFSRSHIMYVKRIVGMPGENFQFDHGRILINGQPLVEPYLYSPSHDWNSPPRMLGPEEYYVVGDNRSMPFENHDKGGAERKRILGQVVISGQTPYPSAGLKP